MMSDYDFERPRAELFTEAACHYIDEGPDTFDGSTNKDKGFGSEEKTVKLELIKVKNISAAFTIAASTMPAFFATSIKLLGQIIFLFDSIRFIC